MSCDRSLVKYKQTNPESCDNHDNTDVQKQIFEDVIAKTTAKINCEEIIKEALMSEPNKRANFGSQESVDSTELDQADYPVIDV